MTMQHLRCDEVLSSEAARLIGVSVQTLRLWERSGRIAPRRGAGGFRLYSRAECLRISDERRAAAENRI
jgi:DNA-binding transcriptional MerR regulator